MYSVAVFCLFLVFGQFVPGSVASSNPTYPENYEWSAKVYQTRPFIGYMFKDATFVGNGGDYGFKLDVSMLGLDSTSIALKNTSLSFGTTRIKVSILYWVTKAWILIVFWIQFDDLAATSVNEADLELKAKQYAGTSYNSYIFEHTIFRLEATN